MLGIHNEHGLPSLIFKELQQCRNPVSLNKYLPVIHNNILITGALWFNGTTPHRGNCVRLPEYLHSGFPSAATYGHKGNNKRIRQTHIPDVFSQFPAISYATGTVPDFLSPIIGNVLLPPVKFSTHVCHHPSRCQDSLQAGVSTMIILCHGLYFTYICRLASLRDFSVIKGLRTDDAVYI